MRFGIDVDGVIADFTGAFIREVNNIWPGRFPVDYQPIEWHWIPESDEDRVWKVVKNKPNWWLSLQAYPENIRAIALHRIRHPDDELFFVTARVSTKGMPPMHQTQIWLNQCGIGGIGTSVIVDHSGDKSAIFNALECDANVDDKLEAVIDHVKRTNGAYLLDRLWNRSGRPSGIPTVRGLDEFFRQRGKSVQTS
jgi:hypothetical protein